MTHLIVIIGPIGAGKTTVAEALAARLVERNERVAVVDVDDVVFMARDTWERFDETWACGRRVHGEVVGAWLRSGVDVVIVPGPAYTEEETAALMADVPAGTPTTRVMLLATYEVALARIEGDPERGLSKDPAFLRSTHERFAALVPSIDPCDHTFDTTTTDSEAIADVVAGSVP